jgi:hypothetical protein
MTATALEAEVKLIKNAGVRDAVRSYLDQVDPHFWTAPSSSSGRHHLANGPGETLVEHTRRATHIADHLAYMHDLPQLLRDYLLAAAICHDTCRGGVTWERTVSNHGELAAQAMIPWPDLEQPSYLVRDHMSWWSAHPFDGTSMLGWLLIESDYLSSRDDILVKL